MNTLTISIPSGVTAPTGGGFGFGQTFFHICNNQIRESEVSRICIVYRNQRRADILLKYMYTLNGLEFKIGLANMFHTKEDLVREVFGVEPAPVSIFDEKEALKLEILSEIQGALGLDYRGADEGAELLEQVYLAWIRGKHGEHSTEYTDAIKSYADDVNSKTKNGVQK